MTFDAARRSCATVQVATKALRDPEREELYPLAERADRLCRPEFSSTSDSGKLTTKSMPSLPPAIS
jgi:hypothetical protein